MIYPAHDLTGAEWTAPEFIPQSTTVRHHWAGWTWRILGPELAGEVDRWRFCRIPPGCKPRHAEVGHGIRLRDWMHQPHPTYDREHAIRLVLAQYVSGWELEHIAWPWYKAHGYETAIKELRAHFVKHAGGYGGGAMGWHTRGGKLCIQRPLEIALTLDEVARRAFPQPGKPVQLSLF